MKNVKKKHNIGKKEKKKKKINSREETMKIMLGLGSSLLNSTRFDLIRFDFSFSNIT